MKIGKHLHNMGGLYEVQREIVTSQEMTPARYLTLITEFMVVQSCELCYTINIRSVLSY